MERVTYKQGLPLSGRGSVVETTEPLSERRLTPQEAIERSVAVRSRGAGRLASRILRVERRLSHWLGRAVLPGIPGLDRPYSRHLARGLVLSRATIPLRGLSEAFDGFRILLVSDLHASPFVSPTVLRDSLRRLARRKPDLIVLAGDFVSGCESELEILAPGLAELREAPSGVIGVLGNHDYYTGEVEALRRRLEREGVRLLINEAVPVERGRSRLTFAGVDDLAQGTPDLPRALSGATGPSILVSHNPDLFFDAARHGADLVLSGHTHGGQIRLPGLPPPARQSRHHLDEGWFRWRDSQLVVSRGIGVVGLPLRLYCPPEAVLLELESPRLRASTPGPAR